MRSAPPSDGGGISSAVQSALGLLDLSLPLTPVQLKQRYRELAMRWHTDHNLGSPQAQEQMKALNSAVELFGRSRCGRPVREERGILYKR
jgi:hypothetical protein